MMICRQQLLALLRLATALVVFLLPVIGHTATAQPMQFSHLLREDGLSQNNVQAILQDSYGYMWFATENGLNRYDGYDIRRYARERGNPDGLPNDYIWVIEEDADKNLWFATQGGGVVRWNRSADTFTSFRHRPDDPSSIASDDIRTLKLNADGTLWVGTRDKGLDLLNPVTGEAQHFAHDPGIEASLSNNMVYALATDSEGTLWVATDGGLNRMQGNGFTRFMHDPDDPRSLPGDNVRSLYRDKTGTMWVGTLTGGLGRFDARSNTFDTMQNVPANDLSLSNNHVRVIFEDDVRRFWVGTADGLNLVDRAAGTVSRYQHDPADPQSLNDSYINSMFQDRGGIIWFGTRSAGISKWNPRSWSLGHYIQPWLSDTDVLSFASAGDGIVWVGTVGAGLGRINEETGDVQRFLHDPENINTISDDRVMALHLDRDGILWIGTMEGGLNRLDTATGDIQVFRHDPDNPNTLNADGVMTIVEDRSGRLWIGTYGGGVSVYNPQTQTFRHHVPVAGDPASLSDPRASAIIQDQSGAMWVGTFGGGLNVFDANSETFTQFHHQPDEPGSLSDETVYALHLDNFGKVWVGTGGGGLDLVQKPTAGVAEYSFQNFSQADGLPSNVIYGIESDQDNRLWLSTGFGLSRLNAATGDIKTFHRGQGLQAEEFNYSAHHRAPNGKLYFGGANGYNAFFPDRVVESSYAPDVILTSYSKLDQPAITNVPNDGMREISLAHSDDIVNFTFAAMDYTAPLQNTYSYTLEGFDTEWHDLGTKRYATYTNLDKGSYVLRVRAVTGDGVATANGLAIPITVAPAPWETLWAYALYVGVAGMLAWMTWRMQKRKFQREAEYSRRLEEDVKLRTKQLRERNVELQVASRAKSDFLARMSHEIRTPMNGMLGMTQLLMDTRLDEKQSRFSQTIKRSAESLLEIINDILDFSKIEAGRLELDKVEVNVTELVDETVELFSGAAAEKGIELMCWTPPGKTISAIGDPLRLKQILVNLLGNALKFTQDGEVVVRYSLLDAREQKLRLRFEITDTGVGVQPENLSMIFKSFSQEDGSTSRRFGGTGLGLAICKQLVTMMGGEIGVDSEPGKGSRFWFTLSLDKADHAWSSHRNSGRLANMKALVVDDNATNSEIVIAYLSALGVSAVSVSSGQDAMRRLNTAANVSPFDVVLLDSDPGDFGGIEVATAIKSNPKLKNTKIVMMTAATTDLDEQGWRKAGVSDCLPKPIRQSTLYESLLMLTASLDGFKAREDANRSRTASPAKLVGRVLLAEDNPVNQAVAIGMLEKIGCDTVVAVNGNDAVEKLQSQHFDVVLMDCEMPVMDGFEATAAIRAGNFSRSDIPIIALTANAIEGDRERCLAAGMQGYLSKPVTVEKLHGTLSQWLQTEPDSRVEKKEKVMSEQRIDSIDAESLDSIRNLQGIGGDRMVRRVVDLYVSNSSMLMEDLRLGVSRRDPEAVRQGAHALKSSSQNVGACGLATLSQKLEELGRRGELTNSEQYMTELDELYPKTVEALKAAVQPRSTA